MKVDIILISDAKTSYFRRLTENAVKSARGNNIYVVESNPDISYLGAITIHPEIEFKYNSYLNIAARMGKSDYILFGNNDIIFEEHWCEELVKSMKIHNVQSASSFCPIIHPKQGIQKDSGVIFGYEIYKFFCGWAFMWTRKMYNELGGLNEDFTFWCSDNAAAEQLKEIGEKHILVTSSVITHVNGGSSTAVKLNKDKYELYTNGEIENFNEKYKTSLFVKDENHPKERPR